MPVFDRHAAPAATGSPSTPGLIMAGWTGRDAAAVQHHIAELAALGVPAPSRVPLFYRLDPALLAGPVAAIEVLGEATSGEVEVVLVALADGLWVGLGSDHTDRAIEAQGVALSKQLCRKPMAAGLWRFDEVDRRTGTGWCCAPTSRGRRAPALHGERARDGRRPEELIAAYVRNWGSARRRRCRPAR